MSSRATCQLTSGTRRGALAAAGCWRLDQVAEGTEAEIGKLHGVGPKAIRLLHSALAAKGLAFASGKKAPPA